MDKKKAILDAALQLFVEFGFHNTATSKIAKKAAVANGTLFYFFPTKDDLVIALYLELKSSMNGCVLKNLAETAGLKDTLKSVYTATVEWALSNEMQFRFIEQFNSSPYLKQLAIAERQKYIQPFLLQLEEGIEKKQIKPLDKEVVMTLISSHTFGMIHYLTDNQKSIAEKEDLIDTSFDLLWCMIKT